MGAPKGRPKPIGAGRVAGTPNKITADLKEMILGALSDVGGRQYLVLQAMINPGPFMNLIGKVLPKDIAIGSNPDNPLVTKIEIEFIDSASPRTNKIKTDL